MSKKECPYCHGYKPLCYKQLSEDHGQGADILRVILMPHNKMFEFYYYSDTKGETMAYVQANYCPVCGRKL